jgi:hypothetical protein
MSWTDDGAIPVGHHDIVAIFQAVRARTIADALFALFEFFEELEVARYCQEYDEYPLRKRADFTYFSPWRTAVEEIAKPSQVQAV